MKKEEIYQQVLDYFNGDSLAADTWISKYAMRNKGGEILESSPEDMHRRLSREFSRIENKYPNPISEQRIFELLDRFKYLVPQGSPMVGIGNDFVLTTLSNCFVIESSLDSYGGIMKSDEEQVQLMKRRGGVGHDLSNLRPSGSLANNSALSGMSGSVLYAERFSNSTKEVRQGDRRGALMLTMSINHPDAEKFIDSKLELGKITDANISIKITDAFMKAVEDDNDFLQSFPIDIVPLEDYEQVLNDLNYNELTPVLDKYNGNFYLKKVKARVIWDKLIHNAWKSAEPGVLFWDKIIKESPADCYEEFKTISTNPCGEIPLCSYDSCRLLAINLYSYVINPFEKSSTFDFDLFTEHVIIAQRLMDDLVDLEIEKLDKIIHKIQSDPEPLDIKRVELDLWCNIKEKAVNGRRTGLGITGEGDMLAALGLTYASPEAIGVSEMIHKSLAVYSYTSSIILAEERGCFPIWNYEKERENPFLNRIARHLYFGISTLQKYTKFGRRNISNLTIAPTGTTSLMTQTTSGIEPCYSISYKRRKRTTDKSKCVFTDQNGEMFEEYSVFHHKFADWYDKNWYKLSVKSFDIDFKKPLEDYSEKELSGLISLSPYYSSLSSDVDWVNKVEMQGVIQKWVDHSISATTNVPNKTSVDVINDIYISAYKFGCKGVTVYRDGSRSGILLQNDDQEFDYIDSVKRPKELECDIYHKTSLKKNWMILVGKYKNRPYEIFAFPEVPNHLFPTKISSGSIVKMKSGVYKLIGEDGGKEYELPNIIEFIDTGEQVDTRKFSIMLRHHIDPKHIIKDIEEYALITSFDKVIQRVLKNYVIEDGDSCEQCGGELVYQERCVKCVNCNWSKCG